MEVRWDQKEGARAGEAVPDALVIAVLVIVVIVEVLFFPAAVIK